MVDCGDPPHLIKTLYPRAYNSTLGSTVTYECITKHWFARDVFTMDIVCDISGDWQYEYTECKGINMNTQSVKVIVIV